MPNHSSVPPPIAIILCAVMEDEIRILAQGMPHIVAIHPLEQGLHNTPQLLSQRLQEAVGHLESTTNAQAITLVYGLCSRGTENVTTRRAQLIVPRAHDCITLLLGSKERYAQYVQQNPGTYWYSPGWNRHHSPPGEERYQKYLAEYRKKFSEEDAQFLMETEQAWFSEYKLAAYVDLGLTPETDVQADIAYTRKCADWLKWSFDRQRGDPQLLRDLLTGPWDDGRFLVLNPGEFLKMTADEKIMARVPLTVRGNPVEAEP